MSSHAALATPATCQAVLGASWDTVQRCRVRHGLPLLKLGSHTPAVEVAPLLEALRREAALPSAEASTPTDPAAAARAALGLRKRGQGG